MDAVRAIIVARIEQMGLSLTEVSKKIGANQAYLQQFVRRGIPAVLPENKREALSVVLGVAPDALRAGSTGRGGPRAISPDAAAQTDAEVDLLRMFRAFTPDQQTKALAVLRALG